MKKPKQPAPDTSHMATGMLFIRKTDVKQGGREVVMVAGVIALPEGCDLEGERQYVTVGKDTGAVLTLDLHKHPSFDISEMSHGNSIDGLLTSPIWRT